MKLVKLVKLSAEKQARLCEGYAVVCRKYVYHKSSVTGCVYRWTVKNWLQGGYQEGEEVKIV